MINDPGRMYC